MGYIAPFFNVRPLWDVYVESHLGQKGWQGLKKMTPGKMVFKTSSSHKEVTISIIKSLTRWIILFDEALSTTVKYLRRALKKGNKYSPGELNRIKYKFTLWQFEGPLDYKYSTPTTSPHCLGIHSMEHTCISVPRDTWVFHNVKQGGRVVQMIVLAPFPFGQATLDLRS